MCEVYEGSGIHQQLALLYQLLETRQDKYDNLEKYIFAVKDLVEKIEVAGIGLAENVSSGILLKDLKHDEHHKVMRTVIERTCDTVDANNKPLLKFSVVLDNLMREHINEEAEKHNQLIHHHLSLGVPRFLKSA